MKRILILILALLSVLSFCSCSDEKSELEKRREAYKNAQKLDVEGVTSDIKTGIEDAKEKHSKKSYTFEGYVSEITKDRVSVIPLVSPINSQTVVSEITVDAYLSQKEIKSISKNDLIVIAGDITDITEGVPARIEMKKAVCMGDTVKITGTVDAFLLNENNEYIIRICSELAQSSKEYKAYFDYNLGKPDTDTSPINEAKLKGKKVSAGDEVSLKIKANYKHKTYTGTEISQICNHYLDISDLVSVSVLSK